MNSYGALLGSEIFQSFIGGVTAFRTLPRPQFATLQSALFPIYFGMQTALPVVLALTFPSERTAIGTSASSFAGILEPANRLHVLTPLSIIFVSGLINAAYVGPLTTKTMRERKQQETKDGKKSYDAGPHSPEMQALNKKFGQLHGASTLVNLFGIIATLWYGFYLGDRLT